MLGEISAANPGKRLRVGIRCNFGVSGSVSRFGIDTASDEFERVLRRIQSSEGLILSGLHCHFSERGAEAWKSKVAGMLGLVEKFGLKEIESVDFGGGFYGEMPDSLKLQFPCAIPSFEEYAEIVALPFAKFAKEYDNPPKLIIEPGTALAADTMCLATKVVSIKNIRRKTIATLSGSIYNINPAANGKNLPVTVYNRDASSAKIYEGADFAGYTCIESDYLHRNYTGKLAEGDFAVFDNAGSYSIVLKPPFILPNFPVICIEESTGKAQLIKKGEDFDDVFHTYVFE
ncbi:MAG: hypothetical protein GX488_07850, partial [Clostridiales bacterium]|nr:hypothetical protein [Clostridiales bacterium]